MDWKRRRYKDYNDFVSTVLSRVDYIPETGCYISKHRANPMASARYANKEYRLARLSLAHKQGKHYDELIGWALHRCDTPSCIAPHHLYEGNAQDNVQDALRRNRHRAPGLSGGSNPQSKLTEEQVQMIRYLRQHTNMSLTELGRMFDIHFVSVHGIVHRKRWKHI